MSEEVGAGAGTVENPPSEEQQRAFLAGGSFTTEPVDRPPSANVWEPTAQPEAVAVEAAPGTPPPIPLPGNFKNVDDVYKSWQESVKMHHRTANKNHNLEEENQRLKEALSKRGMAVETPPESPEQALERFAKNPDGYLTEMERRWAQKYFAPMATAVLELNRKVSQEQTINQIPDLQERALFQRMQSDGLLDSLRDTLPEGDRTMTDRTVFELAKARMTAFERTQLAGQVAQHENERQAQAKRLATPGGGTPPPVGPKTLADMTDEELRASAYEEMKSQPNTLGI